MMSTALRDRPELAAVVEQIDIERGLAVYYRCRECGARWEENLASFMHAEVPILMRTKLDAAGKPVRQSFDLARGERPS